MIFDKLYLQLIFLLQVLKIIDMKRAITALCLVGLGLTGGMKVGLRPQIGSNAYDLTCDGASGEVKYYVEGLPYGVQFQDSAIVVSNFAQFGTYNVRVRAVDSLGQTAERVISLTISQNQGGVAGGAIGSGQIGGAANGGTSGAGSTAGGASGSSPSRGAPSGGAPSGGAPSGGAPGGSPNGGVPAGGAPGSTRLSTIISTYSSTETVRPDYGPSGRYPEPNFPSGSTPNAPNPTTINIGNDQAPRTPANRNPITPDDVALRAASERHQNAIKGITNLLKIIDQAKANKDKAQNDILTYTQAYNDAVAAQRGAQNDIMAAETKVSQISSAINSLTATVDDLRNKIAQAAAQRDALTKEKSTIINNITDLEGAKAGVLEKLKGLDAEVAAKIQELSNKNVQCQSLGDAVAAKKRELDDKQNQLDTNNAARPGVVADITTKSGVVDDLRKRLQDAEKDLADAKIRLASVDALRLALPAKILGLQQELNDLQARAKACADEVTRIQGLINNLKGNKYPELTKQIKDLDDQIGPIRTRVSELDALLASSQGPLEDLKAKLNQATEDLSFLRIQKNDNDGVLRAAYQRGNDSNNRVAFAKQNLDAIIKRFQDESKIISDATLNLERARAEEALARLGLEELIAHYTNALPYAIVPNGNGATNPGTPFGNNPSGSPLGPVNANGDGAPGSFRVNSWTNYLSTAYGAGVNPAYPGSVTQLFPFNFLSGTSGNQAQGTLVNNNYGNIRGQGGQGGCGGSGIGARVTTGVVVEVRQSSFDVRANDGQVFTINVAPCTQLAANVADYTMEAGDKAVVKGYDSGVAHVWNGAQATCLR